MKMAILVLTAALLSAAEPDWRHVEQSAVDLFQQYIRIQSINPPANTAEAARFFKNILDDAGIPSTLYPSGPNGQTNLVARIEGRATFSGRRRRGSTGRAWCRGPLVPAMTSDYTVSFLSPAGSAPSISSTGGPKRPVWLVSALSVDRRIAVAH